jgi:hypothetical protein
MYANGCYWEADLGEDDLWVAGMGKTWLFLDPVIRILPLDLMGGDETKCSPVGRCLRRGGGCSHRGFMLVGGVQVAEKGEFRHTVLGNPHFEVICGELK